MKLAIFTFLIICPFVAFPQFDFRFNKPVTEAPQPDTVFLDDLGYEKLTGPQKLYYQEGKKKPRLFLELNFVDGLREGLQKWYYKNGKLYATVEYKEGKKHGKEVFLWRNGNVYLEHSYKKGRISGVENIYRKNGKLQQAMIFESGIPYGDIIQYWNNGEIAMKATWINGRKQGNQFWYDRDGSKLAINKYLHGELHGIQRSFHNNENILEEIEFVNGKANGEYNFYYKNGVLGETSQYKDNLKEGIETWFDQFGRKIYEYDYVHDTIHGEERWYYEDRLCIVTKYEKGIKQEDPIHYDRNGKPTTISKNPRNPFTSEMLLPKYHFDSIDAEIHMVADVMPQFIYGTMELQRFFHENVVVPYEMKNDSVDRKAYVSVVIDTLGALCELKLLKSPCVSCDTIAIQVIQLSDGLWSPGMKNSKKINVRMTIPVTFKANFTKEHFIDENHTQKDLLQLNFDYNLTTYYNMGVNKMNENKFLIAARYFEIATIFDNHDIDAYYNLGIAYKKGGFPDKACEAWKECLLIGDLSVGNLIDKYCPK